MENNNNALRRLFSKEPVIFTIGQSACGKETLNTAIAKMHRHLLPDSPFYISDTGKFFREDIPQMSPFNRRLQQEIQDSGNIQSWTNAFILLGHHFQYEYNDGTIFIDGSPRSVGESKAVYDFFYGYAKKEIILLYPKVSDEEAERRMISRNMELASQQKPIREDTSTPEKRKTKLAFFHTHVMPAIDILATKPGCTLYEINGEQSRDSVFDEAMIKLAAHKFKM